MQKIKIFGYVPMKIYFQKLAFISLSADITKNIVMTLPIIEKGHKIFAIFLDLSTINKIGNTNPIIGHKSNKKALLKL